MSNQTIQINNFAYNTHGEQVYVVAKIPDGWIACPVFEEDQYVDDSEPTTYKKLFTQPPKLEHEQEIKKLVEERNALIADIREKRNELSELRCQCINAEHAKKQIATEFPELETIVKLKNGEYKFAVDEFRVIKISDHLWDVGRIFLLSISLDRDRKINKRMEYVFFATEEEAKKYAKDAVIARLQQHPSSETIQLLMAEAKKHLIELPDEYKNFALKQRLKHAEESLRNCRERVTTYSTEVDAIKQELEKAGVQNEQD